MAEEELITLGQLARFAGDVDGRLDALETGGSGGGTGQTATTVAAIAITIPLSAWVENDDAETAAAGFVLRADVPVEGLKKSDSADTLLALSGMESAKGCKMAPTAATLAGAVRYYAKEMPTADIRAALRIFKTGTIGSGVIGCSIVIPAERWAENSEPDTLTAGYGFYAEIAVEGLEAADSADTVLALSSLDIAKACVIRPVTEVVEGAVRYYAVRVPTTSLTATLRVFKGQSNEGG